MFFPVLDGQSARQSCPRVELSPVRVVLCCVALGSATCVGMNCSVQRALPENAFLWHARTPTRPHARTPTRPHAHTYIRSHAIIINMSVSRPFITLAYDAANKKTLVR